MCWADNRNIYGSTEDRIEIKRSADFKGRIICKVCEFYKYNTISRSKIIIILILLIITHDMHNHMSLHLARMAMAIRNVEIFNTAAECLFVEHFRNTIRCE